MLMAQCWDSEESHISIFKCLNRHISFSGGREKLNSDSTTIGWVNSCNHSRHQVFEPWLARQRGLLYMKEVISCLNSPALLNQKIELQCSRIMGPAASKPASKEPAMAFHPGQGRGKKHTQEGNQTRCLMWSDTFA